MHRALTAGILLLAAGAVHAADPCPALQHAPHSATVATRIATIACVENWLWYRPFITTSGRLASTAVAEGESSRLADATTPAWRRVALYWRDSGLASQMAARPGAIDCGYAMQSTASSPACRAFVIDNPWSAAFVSYVMRMAGVPGFRASASHFDYVRDARLDPAASPFVFLDPASAAPAAGDMLCYVRNTAQPYGYAGLVATIDAGRGRLDMHCDVVVDVNGGKAYLIGGNVLQAVTMRVLNVNRSGRFWDLPRRLDAAPECTPDSEWSCDFNRQDWALLLKLKPPAALAQLPRAGRPPPAAPVPAPACCVKCVLGAQPPVPRCPVPGQGGQVVPRGSPG